MLLEYLEVMKSKPRQLTDAATLQSMQMRCFNDATMPTGKMGPAAPAPGEVDPIGWTKTPRVFQLRGSQQGVTASK